MALPRVKMMYTEVEPGQEALSSSFCPELDRLQEEMILPAKHPCMQHKPHETAWPSWVLTHNPQEGVISSAWADPSSRGPREPMLGLPPGSEMSFPFQIKELTGNLSRNSPSSSLSPGSGGTDSDSSFPPTPTAERSVAISVKDQRKAIRTLLAWVQRKTRK